MSTHVPHPPRREPFSRRIFESRRRPYQQPFDEDVVDPGALAELRRLVRAGAGTLDIASSDTETPYTQVVEADDIITEREVRRVTLHRESLNRLLEAHVGRARSVLDVGCGTGATSVAMALSGILAPTRVVGIDPNRLSIAAAAARARAHGVADRVSPQAVDAARPIPFDPETFDLTACVSVIEYLSTVAERQRLIAELVRVTRRGGHIFLATPSPFRVHDYHTSRPLGDWRREEGYPWSPPPWQLSAMFAGCEPVDVRSHRLDNIARRLAIPVSTPRWARPFSVLLPWQKVLMRRVD